MGFSSGIHRSNGVVATKGDAVVNVHDDCENLRAITLKKALWISLYKQDIFSVHAATENGASVNFSQVKSLLKAADETIFDVGRTGKLYFFEYGKNYSESFLAYFALNLRTL